MEGKIYYRKREEESQIYKADNAWSINALVLLHVDVVQYQSELRGYQVTAEVAKEFPIYTYNDEAKYYVPLPAWDILASEVPIEAKRMDTFGVGWFNKLRPYFGTGQLDEISQWLSSRLAQKAKVNPVPASIFRAYLETQPEDVKVIFISPEPYHDGMADGIALSYRLPFGYDDSINNIQKELERTHYKKPHLFNPEAWTSQGCLMLNAVLTVEEGHERCHEGVGWEEFTKTVIAVLNELPTTLIFVLLSPRAWEYERYIKRQHIVYKLEPYGDAFVGSNIFNKINEDLMLQKKSEIIW